MVTVQTDNRRVTRDGSRFKKMQSGNEATNQDTSFDDEGPGHVSGVGNDETDEERNLQEDFQAGQSAETSGPPETGTLQPVRRSQRTTAGVPPVRFPDYVTHA